jgi:hypothetical protein
LRRSGKGARRDDKTAPCDRGAQGAVVYLAAAAVVVEVTSTVSVEMAVIVVEAAFATPGSGDVVPTVVTGGHPIGSGIRWRGPISVRPHITRAWARRPRGHHDRCGNWYAESDANSKTNAGEH